MAQMTFLGVQRFSWAQAETVERSGRSGIIGLLLRGLNSATIMGIYSN